jgi:hypothetical protein
VQYVRGNFWDGEVFADLEDAQARAVAWCSEKAGMRIHGTTAARPAEVFDVEEAPVLLPAPADYDVPVFRQAKVHRDHHIEVNKTLYSVLGDYIGQMVGVRAHSELVKIYHRGRLVKIHPAQRPGARSTDPGDLPAEKTAYALRDIAKLIGTRCGPLAPGRTPGQLSGGGDAPDHRGGPADHRRLRHQETRPDGDQRLLRDRRRAPPPQVHDHQLEPGTGNRPNGWPWPATPCSPSPPSKGSPRAHTPWSSKDPHGASGGHRTGVAPLTKTRRPAMLTNNHRWSHTHGNAVVPYRWQATFLAKRCQDLDDQVTDLRS